MYPKGDTQLTHPKKSYGSNTANKTGRNDQMTEDGSRFIGFGSDVSRSHPDIHICVCMVAPSNGVVLLNMLPSNCISDFACAENC